MDLDLIQRLKEPADTKIVLFVLDGLGGLAGPTTELAALEAADTPHLDRLASESACGLHMPVGAGITPGSGPSHLALFGYDPLRYEVGRGVLSALGIDFELTEDDVAARGNFATLTSEGKVADRRAGRISTEKNKELVAILNEVSLPDVQVLVRTVKEHRFLLVLRGKGLDGRISDTDPQELGVEPLPAQAKHPEANESAKLVQRFMEKAQEALADQQPANGVLLRGFSKLPDWPNFPQVTGLRALAIAGYPMYRGVAKLIGMEAAPSAPGLKGVLETAEARWEDADFFFLHTKHVDSRGEDGNFAAKVAEIEEADHAIPRIRALQPDVLIVTGDHSTPAVLKYHSWHPVPVLLWSKHVRQDSVQRFGEQACLAGSLGSRLPATDLLPIALANALRLKKFGA